MEIQVEAQGYWSRDEKEELKKYIKDAVVKILEIKAQKQSRTKERKKLLLAEENDLLQIYSWDRIGAASKPINFFCTRHIDEQDEEKL